MIYALNEFLSIIITPILLIYTSVYRDISISQFIDSNIRINDNIGEPIIEDFLYIGIGEGFAFDFLAVGAPFGVHKKEYRLGGPGNFHLRDARIGPHDFIFPGGPAAAITSQRRQK